MFTTSEYSSASEHAAQHPPLPPLQPPHPPLQATSDLASISTESGVSPALELYKDGISTLWFGMAVLRFIRAVAFYH